MAATTRCTCSSKKRRACHCLLLTNATAVQSNPHTHEHTHTFTRTPQASAPATLPRSCCATLGAQAPRPSVTPTMRCSPPACPILALLLRALPPLVQSRQLQPGACMRTRDTSKVRLERWCCVGEVIFVMSMSVNVEPLVLPRGTHMKSEMPLHMHAQVHLQKGRVLLASSASP